MLRPTPWRRNWILHHLNGFRRRLVDLQPLLLVWNLPLSPVGNLLPPAWNPLLPLARNPLLLRAWNLPLLCAQDLPLLHAWNLLPELSHPDHRLALHSHRRSGRLLDPHLGRTYRPHHPALSPRYTRPPFLLLLLHSARRPHHRYPLPLLHRLLC